MTSPQAPDCLHGFLGDIKQLRLMRELDSGKLAAELLVETPMPPSAPEQRFADVVPFDTEAWLARKQKALR